MALHIKTRTWDSATGKGKGWVVSGNLPGQGYVRKQFRDLNFARAWKAEQELRVRKGLQPTVVRASERRPIVEIVDAFIEAMDGTTGALTYVRYRSVTNSLKRYFTASRKQKLSADKFTADEVSKYMNWLRTTNSKQTGRPMRPSAVNGYRGVLITLFNWAVGEGWMKENPVKRTRKLKTPDDRDVLAWSDVQARLIYDNLRPFYQPYFKFMLLSALRSAEFRGLTWDCIDLMNAEIRIRGDEGKTVKGQEARTVSIPEEAVDILRAQEFKRRHAEDMVFKGIRAQIVDMDEFWRHLKKAIKLANAARSNDVPEIQGSIHTLRHTSITLMLKSGTDIHTVSKLAGHKKITQTMRYLTTQPEHFHTASKRLGDALKWD